ncbi:hypothetical protein PSHT_13332 [Puccinia striiformis]|uniref:Uncharacterized protein n=1 Tax=Puccinia striiformis TaxID=27350 RepID=A0A2S4URE8_9BASI|nr:hypothetical protein PSHT_13332 [Puccinia striiformis]
MTEDCGTLVGSQNSHVGAASGAVSHARGPIGCTAFNWGAQYLLSKRLIREPYGRGISVISLVNCPGDTASFKKPEYEDRETTTTYNHQR